MNHVGWEVVGPSHGCVRIHALLVLLAKPLVVFGARVAGQERVRFRHTALHPTLFGAAMLEPDENCAHG